MQNTNFVKNSKKTPEENKLKIPRSAVFHMKTGAVSNIFSMVVVGTLVSLLISSLSTQVSKVIISLLAAISDVLMPVACSNSVLVA